MTAPNIPNVETEQHHTILAVSDLEAAVDFYTNKLGFWLAFKWGSPPSMAGVNLGHHVQIFLQKGTPNPEGCSLYFVVSDVDELYEFHRANDVEIVTPPDNRDYEMRDYGIRDLHGYRLDFGQHLMKSGPPVKIERVEVPVRLEKRLAALLHDLAEYKQMSVSSCLEEMILHTSEPEGDGVASPHTHRQIKYIQELKRKHGIDYDTHASYRFVEE